MNTIKTYQRAVTLIEMLVTLLVLSIGLLGVAALQSRGQQFNFASYVRTQTTMLGNEMMEQILANVAFARNDVLTNGTGVGNGYVVDSSNIPGISVNYCDDNPCTNTELRDYDLARWYGRLAATLPSGTGSISAERIPEPPSNDGQDQVRYTISITWTLRESEREDASVETKTITWVMQI
ncbi:MAG: type IV pilus modification protein PilV [Pseudomonadota bacterium]